MSKRGHNENAVRLSILADEARSSLDLVAQGEAEAIHGWLAYGAALNEGRSLFPGDAEFGKWVEANSLSQLGTAEVDRNERSAAMWAAAHRDQFEKASAAGKARTVRGIHDKWKQIEAERERAAKEAERKAEEELRRAEAEEAARIASNEGGAGGSRPDQIPPRPEPEPKPVDDEQISPQPGPERGADQADESKSDQKPDAADADIAKIKKQLAKLTDDALFDEIIGLRADNDDLRKQIAAVEVERDELKAAVRDLSESNQGAVIGRMKRELASVKFARDEALAAAKREEYKRKQAEARVNELQSAGFEIAV